MGMIQSSKRFKKIIQEIDENKDKWLKFGIRFLDEATKGIGPNDLVLIGAKTGIGKTELCVSIAMHNLECNKKVHMFALEADVNEIERRIYYGWLAKAFFSDPHRPEIKLNFADWVTGRFRGYLDKYEDLITDFTSKGYKNLYTFYKEDEFTVDDMVENIYSVSEETDLIILDHLHYLDWDEPNDNRALKEIAKAAREVSIYTGKPIILVGHLRKNVSFNKPDLVPGVEEFHGSSDITKIATKVITMSPGVLKGKSAVTFMRVPKNRMDGTATKYVGKTYFNISERKYEDDYKLGWSNSQSFEEIAELPDWYKRSNNLPVVTKETRSVETQGVQTSSDQLEIEDLPL